jgi:hypothetical protein
MRTVAERKPDLGGSVMADSLLERDQQNQNFRRRNYVFQRVSWCILTILIVAALAGTDDFHPAGA